MSKTANNCTSSTIWGLNFAGFLYVKENNEKYYTLLITCFITRNVHMELIKGMTTQEFLLAFHRFLTRRGLCSIVYSDNAKLFKLTEIELKQMWMVINHLYIKILYDLQEIN